MIARRRTRFSLLLAAALLFLLIPQRAQAAEEAAVVTVSFDREQYVPGETAMVQIRAAAVNSAISLSGLEFQLSDAEGLELQTLTMALGADDTSTGVSDASAKSGRGVFCQYGSEPLTVDKDGILVAEAAYLVTGQPGDTVQLGLDEWMLLQADSTELTAGQQHGQALVVAAPDTPTLTLCTDNTVCKAGDIITVTLSLTGEEASYDIYGLNDTIAFDPACFELLPDSVTASIGDARGMKTGEVYDRVYFMRFGTAAETVTKDAPIVTFRLKVLKGGAICHKQPALSDDTGKTLPVNVQDTAVSLYDLEHQPPLAWMPDDANLVLRNYSDDSVTASLWLACYSPGGQMRSVSLLARQTLDGGAQVTVPWEAPAISDDETAKLLVTGEGCIPLSTVLELK